MSLTKVTYSMIEGSPVNVVDFGAIGDGVANDTLAIQNAMDSGASSIYFPNGTYLSDEVTVPSTVHYIYGSGTFKQRATDTKLMTFNSITNITVDGMTFQGNYTYPQATQSSDNTGVTFLSCNNVKVVNCSFSFIQFIGLRFINCRYVVCSNNRMNYVGNGIYLQGTRYVTITGNILTNTIAADSLFVIAISCESTDGHAYGICTNIVIDSNVIDGYRNAQGIMAHSLTRGTISNNVVNDPILPISLIPFNATDDITEVTIVGNTVRSIDSVTFTPSGNSGIIVQAGGSAADINYVTIANNIIIDANRAAQANNQGGIQIGYTKNVSVTGNVIHNAFCNGIVLTEDEDGIAITGNVIKDINEIPDGTLNGIIALGAPKGNITANTFQNINSAVGIGYGVRFNAANGMYVGDNYYFNVEALGTGLQNTINNGRTLVLSGTETSINLNNVDVVVFQQSAPSTISAFTGVVEYKKYTFYFVNGNTTIDRNNAFLNGGVNITGTQYDVVEMLGISATKLAQVAPISVNS